ncbi:MAG: ABC transporter permease [Oscillospiraceae bacterium]|jgi:ribose transport system permease protein|nr:ABC transporter permease [Oscillospiraceae bacterium]
MENKSLIKRAIGNKSAALIAVSALVILFFYFMNHNFLGRDCIRGILNAMSLSGTIGVGVACLLIGGGVDLSAGTVACFGGVICAMLIQAGVPWPAAVIASILFGAFTGAINAFFINVLGFASFIVTIGMSSVYGGVINIITNVQNLPVNDASFWKIGTITILNYFPMPFIIMLALMAIYSVILGFTGFGRSCYICGGNPFAARLSGLNPKKTTTILYINCGALSALSGVVLSARMHSASPTAASSGALDAITAAVLGGVSFMGGAGGMGGCLIGLLLLNSFKNGLTIINLKSYWQIVAQGVLLVIALCVDFLNERASGKALKRQG